MPSACRDTAAWTVGRICEYYPLTLGGEIYQPLINAFLESLDDEPRVAHNVCFAIHNLAQSMAEMAEEESPATNMLSPIFMPVMEKLVKVSEREDWQENNLRASAYEAINMMIDNSAADCDNLVLRILPLVMSRLEATLAMQVNSADDKEDRDTLQACLCGSLQVRFC